MPIFVNKKDYLIYLAYSPEPKPNYTEGRGRWLQHQMFEKNTTHFHQTKIFTKKSIYPHLLEPSPPYPPLISHICEEMGENIQEMKIFQIKE